MGHTDEHWACRQHREQDIRKIEQLESEVAGLRLDRARLDVIANNAGAVVPELLNGNDEDDELPEGFRVEMVFNGRAYQAEDVDLRAALDKLREDVARSV